MGEGVECGKVSHEHMVVNGIEGQGTEDKGTEKVVESGSPPIASHADGSGVEADSQAVASSSGVLVADSQVVASSSEVGGKIAANTSTPAREDLIDAYGFQLVVRKGKNVSVGREQSREMRILASAIQSRVPLNSKGVAMVIGRNKKKDLTEDNSLAVLEQESVCKEPQSADESFYRQKSRVQRITQEVKEIGKLAVEYYKGLLGAADSNVQPFPVEYFVQPFSVEYFAELLMKIKYYLIRLGFLWESYMFDIWECRFCQVN
ncbi:unnamed protein product [Linum trigynum]|uniref:Uncharacterized protein n=1 Tax=Linum trigynum TaxID=586398 RepID=A0AAV2G0Y2_9ROSI